MAIINSELSFESFENPVIVDAFRRKPRTEVGKDLSHLVEIIKDNDLPLEPTRLTQKVGDSMLFVQPLIDEAMSHLPLYNSMGNRYTDIPSDIPLFPPKGDA